MPATRSESPIEVLAAYLFASTRIEWPGTDGMDLETVVLSTYPAALRAGHVPDLAELKRRHASLAAAIDGLFTDWLA